MNRLADFMRAIARDTYPEPRTSGHDHITAKVMPLVTSRLPKGARILDVGCGQGNALWRFKAEGFQATGIALNPEDVQICHSLGYAVHEMDQNDLHDAWTGAFDCVWARHVLEHSVAPYFTLHEFWRVLKSGGWLYVEVPAPDTACAHETNQNHYSVLGKTAWLCLLQRAGFSIREVRTINLETQAGPDTYFSFIARKP